MLCLGMCSRAGSAAGGGCQLLSLLPVTAQPTSPPSTTPLQSLFSTYPQPHSTKGRTPEGPPRPPSQVLTGRIHPLLRNPSGSGTLYLETFEGGFCIKF